MFGPMSGPPRPWELDANSRRQRVRSYLLQAALWAPTAGGKDSISEALKDQQDWDNGSLAWARRNRAQQRPSDITAATNAKSCQSSSDHPLPGSTSEVAAADRLWWYSVIVECCEKQSLSSNVNITHHLTQRTDSHPATVRSKRVMRQAFLQSNISFLTICDGMAKSQQSFVKRGQPEEWYPQAAAHFHDFAKARILQKAEFVRKGSSRTFTPKKYCRRCGPRRTTSFAQGVCGPGKGKHNTPRCPVVRPKEEKIGGVPDVRFYYRSWNPAVVALHSSGVSVGITEPAVPN